MHQLAHASLLRIEPQPTNQDNDPSGLTPIREGSAAGPPLFFPPKFNAPEQPSATMTVYRAGAGLCAS